MATERIIVVVEDRGTRKVQKNIKAIGDTSKRSSSSVALLTKSLVGLAAVAGIRKAIGTLATFEQGLSTVKGITQATEAQMASLRDVAKELGATTRFSATQATEGLVFLSRAGFSVEESLVSISDTLLLAQAGALDLGSAADIASNVLRGFRLEADQAGRAVDVLALASNSANTTVQQLGDGMKFVAPVAAGLNVSLEETTAVVGTLSDAGLQATLAGTGLRRILSELESPAGKTKKILDDLGLSTDDVKVSQVGLTEALTRLRDAGLDTGLALEVFGDRGGPAFEVLSSGIPQVVRLTEELENAEGSAAALAAEMDDNLNGALLSAKSALEAVVLAFGDLGITDGLENTFRGIAASLRALANNLEDVMRVLVPFGVTMAALKLAPFVQGLILSAQASSVLSRQLAAGSVVLLGSAEAERQKTIAQIAGIEADIAKTTSTLANIRAELQRAIVVKGSSTAMFAQIAVEKQLTLIEAQLTVQTTALTAAQGRLAVSTKAAAIEASLFRTTLLRLQGTVKALGAVILANPIAAAFVGLAAVVGLLVAFDDQIKVTTAGFSTLEDVFAETLVEVRSILQDIGVVFEEVFGEIPAFLEPIIGQVDFTVGGILLSMADFADRFVGFFEGAVFASIEAFRGLGPAIQDLAISGVNALVRAIEVAIRSIQAIVLGVADSVGIVVRQVALGITNLAEASRQALAGNIDDARMFAETSAFLIAGAAEAGFDGFVGKVQDNFDELDADQLLNRLVNPSEGAAAGLGEAVGDAFFEGFNRTNISDATTDILDRAEQRALQRVRDAQALAADQEEGAGNAFEAPGGVDGELPELNERAAILERINVDLAEQARLLGLTNQQRQLAIDFGSITADLAQDNIVLTSTERLVLGARLANLQALQDQATLLDEIQGPQLQLEARQNALNALFQQGRISADEYAEGLRNIARASAQTDQTLQGGFMRGLQRIDDQIFNFSDQAETTLVNAFGGAEDALVDFVTTGKVDFSGFVDSLLADLTRLLARQALFSLLGLGTGGGGFASLFSSFGGARAEGGPVNPDQAFLVGEKGPEIFQPDRPGNIIPNNQMAAMAPAAPPQVNVSVINVSDPNEVSDALDDPAVQDKIVNVVIKQRGAVKAGLKV